MKLLLCLAILAGLGWGGFAVAAGAYRAQNCVLIMGHWLSLNKTTNPLFCQ